MHRRPPTGVFGTDVGACVDQCIDNAYILGGAGSVVEW